MKKIARFIYAPQNSITLDGPFITHTRLPLVILEMEKSPGYVYNGHKNASFKIIIGGEALNPAQLTKIEEQAGTWFFSQISQGLVSV